ncbi:MAG: hypothetical protein V4517_21230 [Pseudomonadota bacterium]
MLRIFTALVLTVCIGATNISSASAADAWGCSYDKCVAYCTKVAGKYCSQYCSKRLTEKQLQKVCK